MHHSLRDLIMHCLIVAGGAGITTTTGGDFVGFTFARPAQRTAVASSMFDGP